MKLHPLLGHPVSENFVSWCQTLKNIVFMFVKTLTLNKTFFILYVYRKPIPSPRSRNLKVIKKMCTFEVHLCMMSGQLILSGKPFNTFSMARLNILQLRLTLTLLFTTTKDPTTVYKSLLPCMACIFFLSHYISVIGVFFFILVTLHLCLLLIYRYL